MRIPRNPVISALLGLLFLIAGCGRTTPEGAGAGERPTPPVSLSSGPRDVVEAYLRAAAKADGAAMYALLASSERKEETPESLRKTAADRYGPDLSWEIVRAEEEASTSQVVVDLRGVKKVEPNPYRFTLTKEAGEWRIVQSPELHEDDDDLKIRIN